MKVSFLLSLFVAASSVYALAVDKREFQHAPEGYLPGVSQAVSQLNNEEGKTTAGDVYSVFDGLDHIADFLVYTAGSGLSPLTGGVSNGIANFLSGPIVQSLTHGTFALASHVAGDVPDMLTGRKQDYENRLGQTQNKLQQASGKLQNMGIDTSSLDSARQQLAKNINANTNVNINTNTNIN